MPLLLFAPARYLIQAAYTLVVVVLPQLHFVALAAVWLTASLQPAASETGAVSAAGSGAASGWRGGGVAGSAGEASGSALRTRTACEVLYAWSALDVFVVSLIVSVLQIRQFAAFIIGDKCDAINPLLEQ